MKKDTLRPHDFPIENEKEKLKTQTGKVVGSAISEELAQDVADRLNEQEQRNEEDRWSA